MAEEPLVSASVCMSPLLSLWHEDLPAACKLRQQREYRSRLPLPGASGRGQNHGSGIFSLGELGYSAKGFLSPTDPALDLPTYDSPTLKTRPGSLLLCRCWVGLPGGPFCQDPHPCSLSPPPGHSRTSWSSRPGGTKGREGEHPVRLEGQAGLSCSPSTPDPIESLLQLQEAWPNPSLPLHSSPGCSHCSLKQLQAQHMLVEWLGVNRDTGRQRAPCTWAPAPWSPSCAI